MGGKKVLTSQMEKLLPSNEIIIFHVCPHHTYRLPTHCEYPDQIMMPPTP